MTPVRARQGRPRLNLPNALSLVRIVLAPFLMALLIARSGPYTYAAASLFLAAALTDWLDGRIARTTNRVSTLGQLLDPVADKLLIAAALIALVQVDKAPAWMVVLIVGREIAVTGLRAIAAAQGVIIVASEFGKAKMVAEVVAVSLLILAATPLVRTAGVVALAVALALALGSGLDYFWRFVARTLQGREG
jgi:CDP-diacylglycerol--glycerol-3-phosphate 3-phosphatidyltransferase